VILEHLYSCQYGTFLYNSEQQRVREVFAVVLMSCILEKMIWRPTILCAVCVKVHSAIATATLHWPRDMYSQIVTELEWVETHDVGVSQRNPQLSLLRITNSVIGVSRPPVPDYGTTFHLDYGGRDLPLTPLESL